MVLVPPFIITMIWFESAYLILLGVISCLMLIEWFNITKNTTYAKYGPIIIIPPIICLMLIRTQLESFAPALLYFCSIWSVDTFAMLGGRIIGGCKLAPTISPNKTWSGLLCGCIASSLVCHVFGMFFSHQALGLNLLAYGALNGLIAQSSDLFISYFKRKCNAKDSGTLLPGHGGILDRFDSIIFSAPFFLLALKYL